MFCGRGAEIMAIEQSLFQTKHGNPKHFLIEGERGIGKSSLMMYIDGCARGAHPISTNEKFNFIVISVELNDGMEFADIVRKVAVELKIQLWKRYDPKTIARSIFDFVTNWKILGVEYKRDNNISDPTEVLEELARLMCEVIEKYSVATGDGKEIDGILLLIDEADKPAETAGLGSFVKLLTERLSKLDCNQVCLGLAGLPSLIPRLRASHESAPRVFETLTLQPLEDDEVRQVVKGGLDIAKEKNKRETVIENDAMNTIVMLSEGYPHFIQQFAYSAFDRDTDFSIDNADVLFGAFKENGALDQLGKRYFSTMYFDSITSEDYRRVLHGMAEHMDKWMSRQEIIKSCKIKDSQVTNALNALKTRGILLTSEEHKGKYRLPSKSFAVWLKALEEKRKSKSSLS